MVSLLLCQEYSKQVKANASALAEALKAKGLGAQPWLSPGVLVDEARVGIGFL